MVAAIPVAAGDVAADRIAINMIMRFIKWLERRHLNHAAITFGLMYPTILIHQAMGPATAAAFLWIFGYWMREVTQYGRLGFWRSMWPGNWTGFHDRIQTLYVVIVGVLWAVGWNYYAS